MALPTCPKCENTQFQMQSIVIAFSSFHDQAVTCTKCGCIVAILEPESAVAAIRELATKLGHPLS